MEEKKRSAKKPVLLALVLLLAAGLAALPFLLDRMTDAAGDGASLLSATVQRGDVSRTISGAGTLGARDTQRLTVPQDVVITGYAVSDGDLVKAGDPVVWVDKVSVYSVIATLGEELDSITEELAEVQNTYASTYITSNVAGTVTAVYAKAGDDIRQVMEKYGALAEITLDNGTALKVSALSGTVLWAFIEEGDAVFVNANLFSVADVETMGAYGGLVLRHQRIEEQLAQLFRLYRDGYLAAPADGMILDTDETLVKKLSAEGETGTLDFLVARPGETGTVVYLADNGTRVETEFVSSTLVESVDSSGQGVVSGVYGTVDFSDFPGARSGDTVFMREDSTYVTGLDGTEHLAGIRYTVLLVESSGDKNKDSESGDKSGSSRSGGSSGGSGGGNTATSSAAATQSAAGAVTLATRSVATLVDMEEALVSISVDELDILTLRVGDAAQITLDALPGRSFTGVVTGVNTSRSNSGGNSKYTVEVTVPRSPEMLDGMNASCVVTVETLHDVLTVPAAALCDENGVSLMYTALSRDKTSLSEPVPVEVGFSDGETLEILSGLGEGDTVWYTVYDTPEFSLPTQRSGSMSLFGFGAGNTRRRS